jgi:hypothetical protein
VTLSGDEGYYNHGFYKNGWSYQQTGLGTPLITRYDDVRPGRPHKPTEYFSNNRVLALQFCVDIVTKQTNFLSKILVSKNWGTYSTSSMGSSIGGRRYPPQWGIFSVVYQSSLYFEAKKKFTDKYFLSCSTTLDYGQLLNNSFGLLFKITKIFK